MQTGVRYRSHAGAAPRLTRPALTLLAILATLSPHGFAEPIPDAMRRLPNLYSSDEGLIRSVDLSGRLQADAAWYDADQGEFDDILWRRFRFGFKSALAHDLLLHVEADFNLNESPDDWYNKLTEAYIGWDPGQHLELRLLKHSAGFTLDGATSSKRLLTLQRNNITNNLWFTEEYFTGFSASGVLRDNWHYRAGVFSGDGDAEISVSEGGVFVLASVGYDLADTLGLQQALLRLDYVNNEEDRENNTREFSDILSLSSQWEGERWGFRSDLAWGRGYFDQSDIRGLSLMPFFKQSELLQWVFRYTYLSSEDDNGLRFHRYEREIVAGRGDEYKEAYLGLNLFFNKHKVKWQTGLQYTSMEDAAGDGGEYAGWGLTTGLRLYW